MTESSPKASPPQLSIVIPAYGGDEELEKCLQAIAREEAAGRLPPQTEIVVADDATPGGLKPELIEKHKERVNFVFGQENLGFAGNANRGVAASTGSLLCLLNTDMYVEPGYFEGCFEDFEGDPKLFAVTGQINEPNGNNDGYKTLSMRGTEVSMETVQTEHPLSSQIAAVPYANGGGSFFRRGIFEDLGGFDPVFTPYYWEDTDLGYRAWKRGYHIRYDPKRKLFHDHQGTIGKHKKRRVKRIFKRNRRFFIWRNNSGEAFSTLLWQSSLKPMLKAFLTFRWGKAGEYLGDWRAVPGIVRMRKEARRLEVRTDKELTELWQRESQGALASGAKKDTGEEG